MSRIKLKNYSEIFKKFKNAGNGGPQKYKNLYFKIPKHASTLLKQFKNNSTIYDNKTIFTLLYKNIPSKSNRINFRKKINSFKDIPQIDMTTEYNEGYYSKVTYLLNDDEANDFCDRLLFISKITSLTKEYFENDLKKLDKIFIKRIFKIINIIKNDSPPKIDIYKYIKIIPVFDKQTLINIFKKLEINFNEMNWNTYIMLVSPEDYIKIYSTLLFLIGHIYENETFSVKTIILDEIDDSITLDKPKKTIIGVIDSGIQLPNIFNDYIEYHDKRQMGKISDISHGSGVSSLIIANDKLNPGDNDSFGQFKVRHFELLEIIDDSGLARVNNTYLYEKIEEIVKTNKDIKIWNLSLGSQKNPFTINISLLGKLLDILSKEEDCLFIVASGNSGSELGYKSICSPADSLNSLSVGSVVLTNKGIKKSNYSSWGPVNHYVKPEISHFGGPSNMDGSPIRMFYPKMSISNMGTSFSAPKIARFAAYLIEEGLTPQQVKANIIASSTRETEGNKSSSYGWVNFKESHSLDGEIVLLDNKPKYLDLNMHQNVELISIASSALTTNVPIMGEEYNLMNVEISLIGYKDNLNEPEREIDGKKNVSESPKQSKYKIENYKRFEDGKYFTSKKKDYTIENVNLLLNLGYKIALRIRKLNLYDIINEEKLNVAFSIKMFGKNLTEENITSINNNIIEINVETEISI